MNSSENENLRFEYKNENENEIENDNTMNNNDLDIESNETMQIYEWVDSFQLSRPKKNIARDFSDGLLLAEILKKYVPKLVDLHNYPDCSSTKHKLSNWETLNNKVLKKLGLRLTKNEINDVIFCKPNAIEELLKKVYNVIQNIFGKNNIRAQVEKGNMSLDKQDNNALKKRLEEKENIIKELNSNISLLEMKLNSTIEYNQKLEEKINENIEKVREKGYDYF
jgi:hypothetical protein